MSPNIEEHIRRAMEDGLFDDLPGKGKPLHLEDHPFEDPEWRMAYHVLRTGGFSLPWIETRREIEEAFLARRAKLCSAPGNGARKPCRIRPLATWQRASGSAPVQAFRQQVEDLNRRIFSYNLEVPNERFGLAPLNFERQLQLTTSPASDTI